jgi:hypothetical protein
MISLEEFKTSLGSKSKELTDEQIIKLRNQMDKIADILFNMWIADKRKGKS